MVASYRAREAPAHESQAVALEPPADCGMAAYLGLEHALLLPHEHVLPAFPLNVQLRLGVTELPLMGDTLLLDPLFDIRAERLVCLGL